MPEEDTEEDGEDVEEKLAAAEVGDFILAQEVGRGEEETVTLEARRAKVLRQQEVNEKKERRRRRREERKELKKLQVNVMKLMEENRKVSYMSLKRRVKNVIKKEDGDASSSRSEDCKHGGIPPTARYQCQQSREGGHDAWQ